VTALLVAWQDTNDKQLEVKSSASQPVAEFLREQQLAAYSEMLKAQRALAVEESDYLDKYGFVFGPDWRAVSTNPDADPTDSIASTKSFSCCAKHMRPCASSARPQPSRPWKM
jgi:hypothetical protein